MKIEEVKLCVNCEEVFSYRDSRDGSCPVCGSLVTIFVNQALAGKQTGVKENRKEAYAC